MSFTTRLPGVGSPRDFTSGVQIDDWLEVYFVASESDVVISEDGPADYIIVADGSNFKLVSSGTGTAAKRLMKSRSTGDVTIVDL